MLGDSKVSIHSEVKGTGCWWWRADELCGYKLGVGSLLQPELPTPSSPRPAPASTLEKGITSCSFSQGCPTLGQSAQLQRPLINRKYHSNANRGCPGLCGVTSPERSLAKLWANTHRPQRSLGTLRKEKMKSMMICTRGKVAVVSLCRLSLPFFVSHEV